MPHSFHSSKKIAKSRSVAASLSGKGARSMKRPAEPLSEAPAGDQPVTQRYAFINGEQYTPAEKPKDKKIGKLIGDKTIRDFKNEGEMQRYAARQTDYIGNVGEEKIWVRFQEDGVNLIGENHEFITLKDVLAGVFALEGGKWVYEGFTDMEDELNDRKGKREEDGREKKELHREVKDMHEEEGLYKDYGIDRTREAEHAAESILPRIGFILSRLFGGGRKVEKVPDKKTFPLEDVPEYDLQAMAMYLKYAWKYGKDVIEEVRELKDAQRGCFCNGYKRPEKTKALMEVIAKVGAEIDPFIRKIKRNTSLADSLEEESDGLQESLVEFADAMLDYLVFIKSQANSGTSDDIKLRLQNAQTPDEKYNAFAAMRNERFRTLVSSRKTADDFGKEAIRYAGMGANHLAAFQGNEWKDGRKFDMQPNGDEYLIFKQDTEALRQKVKEVPQTDKSAEPEEIKVKRSGKKKKVIEDTNEEDKPPRRKKGTQPTGTD